MSDKLLSLPRGFKKEKIEIGVSNVFISLCSTHRSNLCPVCSTRSSSIHSCYYRHLQDLELAGKRVYINLKAHKFYCRNPVCSRKIFVEDISSLTDKYSRRTNRAQKRVLDVSLESSSRKSSYLLSLQGLDVSSSTCVRSVLRSPLPDSKKLRYIGIDDFAGKKGCYYYSIVVDLITGKPVDVLSDRSGTIVKEWLKEHPQLLVISRDRARCFAQPIEEILPQVTQICDRFHLLKNLSEQVIKEVKRIAKGKRIKIEQEKFELPTNEYILESLRKKLFFLGERPHVNKVQRYIRIHELLGKGYKTRQIAEDIGVKSKLVYRYTHVEKLEKFLSIEQRTLLKHMEAIARLLSHGIIDSHEIAEKLDNKVKKEWIARLTIDIRNEFKTRMREIRSTFKQIKNSKKKIPSKEIFKSFFQEAYKTNNPLLQVILQKEPIRKMTDICKKFKIMINRRNDSISLRKWIDNASNSGMKVLRDFAKGIQREYDAVQAAIDFQWSNGVVEGNVNRIKNLKRQMYGRASLPLLKRKIILAKFG